MPNSYPETGKFRESEGRKRIRRVEGAPGRGIFRRGFGLSDARSNQGTLMTQLA